MNLEYLAQSGISKRVHTSLKFADSAPNKLKINSY